MIFYVTKPKRGALRLTPLKGTPDTCSYLRGYHFVNIYIYRMTVLHEIIINKIMCYVSHPIADLMKPVFLFNKLL